MSNDLAYQDFGKQDLKGRFIEMRAKGYPYTKIAKKLMVSKSTLINWNAELEKEISIHKAIELEALQEEFFVLKEGRLRLLGEVLLKVKEEALSRSLAEVPTEKLLDILLKYHNELKGEYVEPRPMSSRDMKTRSGMKLTVQDMEEELTLILDRYRAGVINIDQAKEETTLLLAVLKAKELGETDEKIRALEAVLEGRR